MDPHEIETLLEEIERLDKAATPGKWYAFSYQRGETSDSGILVAAVAPGQQIRSSHPGGSFPMFDQNFIAASRTLLPQAARVIAELRKRVEELEAEAEELHQWKVDHPYPDCTG